MVTGRSLAHAKPILDKYGFKATFYIVCNYLETKPGFMDCKQVKQLYEAGYDIGSHSMNHVDLSKLSKKYNHHQEINRYLSLLFYNN
ncbi:MAG TPA: polysaccharide deacetylase family protein [Nitrososphaeraceae archaeon]|jgi:peptidoglycan/xylan/chitin deacetylase (PgdA/CDA1 family)|nr:polysaccharide deacetylase family protein [Nitrososphaeraceae archaeon]